MQLIKGLLMYAAAWVVGAALMLALVLSLAFPVSLIFAAFSLL